MNDADKQDLDEQIEHHKEMLRILRRRLRVQERKEAEFGISVPAEVATEIMTLSERIAKHEAELGRLRSIAAEGDIPLAEVEYRAALATAWEPGKPTVAGAANLEWVRLRTGIKTNRAEVLEKEVRAALAEEAVDKVPSYEFTGRRNLCVIVVDDSQNGRNFYYEVPPLFLALDKYDNRVNLLVAIYLDVAKTIYLISKNYMRGTSVLLTSDLIVESLKFWN